MAHPDFVPLVRDAVRLPFVAVELSGEASRLGELSDSDLAGLKGVRRVDAALYGPDAASHDAHAGVAGAFVATLEGLSRVSAVAGVPTGAYAVVHDASQVDGFAAAWARGALPGPPGFRLSPRGGSLDDLATAAAAPGAGEAGKALAALLPPCLVPGDRTEDAKPREERPQGPWNGEEVAGTGSGRFGRFVACSRASGCAASVRCPGIAEGWLAAEIRPFPKQEAGSS
jgi:hypothetical protein